MSTTTASTVTTQVYRVYIKATPQAIWDAITKPEWSERYGFGGRVEIDLRPGGVYRVPTTEAMHAAAAMMGCRGPRRHASTERSSRPIPLTSSSRPGGC